MAPENETEQETKRPSFIQMIDTKHLTLNSCHASSVVFNLLDNFPVLLDVRIHLINRPLKNYTLKINEDASVLSSICHEHVHRPLCCFLFLPEFTC